VRPQGKPVPAASQGGQLAVRPVLMMVNCAGPIHEIDVKAARPSRAMMPGVFFPLGPVRSEYSRLACRDEKCSGSQQSGPTALAVRVSGRAKAAPR